MIAGELRKGPFPFSSPAIDFIVNILWCCFLCFQKVCVYFENVKGLPSPDKTHRHISHGKIQWCSVEHHEWKGGNLNEKPFKLHMKISYYYAQSG